MLVLLCVGLDMEKIGAVFCAKCFLCHTTVAMPRSRRRDSSRSPLVVPNTTGCCIGPEMAEKARQLGLRAIVIDYAKVNYKRERSSWLVRLQRDKSKQHRRVVAEIWLRLSSILLSSSIQLAHSPASRPTI